MSDKGDDLYFKTSSLFKPKPKIESKTPKILPPLGKSGTTKKIKRKSIKKIFKIEDRGVYYEFHSETENSTGKKKLH